MVLQNYVILKQGIPARMHFTDHIIQTRDITDSVTLRTKPVNALVFTVDRLNGNPVSAQFSTIAETLADQFAAYLPEKRYRAYDFIVTQRGTGFQTRYTVEAIPTTSK